MNISPSGIGFIKGFEKCELTAYPDEGGVWTIGWGHTGPEVKKGLVWTQQQADDQLARDIAQRAVAPVNRLVTWHAGLSQPQFDALCSFVYNDGEGNLASSKLLRCVNWGQFASAADQFLLWDHVHVDGNLVESAGLKARREAERAMFLSGT